jgi:hypothetical protein
LQKVRAHFIAAVSFFCALAGAPLAQGAGYSSGSTVFVIVMENHNWADILGNADAPYINGTLLPMASYAEQYYNPPGVHPSEPNYLWLEAGTGFGIADDNLPAVNHQSTTNHFVTQLRNAGISWKTYQENITGASCPTEDNYPYAPKHNPFVFFDDVLSGGCSAVMRPFTELANDLSNGTLAHYNFITPNLINDMHDAGPPLYNPIKQGDTWLAQNLPMILQSAAYQNNGLILITWDEGENSSDGPIGMIVLSPLAKGGGYHNAVHYTHSSTLRTLQKIFGVGPLLGGAATSVDLSDLFVINAVPNADSLIPIGIMRAPGMITVSWLSQPGLLYRVEWKNRLADDVWQTLLPGMTGTGDILSLTDDGAQTGGLASQRFYRVIVP